MILHAMNPYFDQILTSQEVPSMKDLTRRLLRVPTLKIDIFKNLFSLLPWFLLVEKEGVVVEGILNVHIVKECVVPKRIVTLYMAFLTRQPIFLNLKLLSQSSIMKNIKNIWGQNPIAKHNHLQLLPVGQKVAFYNLWRVKIHG